MFSYSTAQRQFDAHGPEHTWLAQVSPVPACTSKGHTHIKRISVTDNDAGFLHTTQFFILACLFHAYT